jgi:hypothetical protein
LNDNDSLDFQHSSSVVPDLLVDRSERELLTSRLDLQRQMKAPGRHCIAWPFQPCFLWARLTFLSLAYTNRIAIGLDTTSHAIRRWSLCVRIRLTSANPYITYTLKHYL